MSQQAAQRVLSVFDEGPNNNHCSHPLPFGSSSMDWIVVSTLVRDMRICSVETAVDNAYELASCVKMGNA